MHSSVTVTLKKWIALTIAIQTYAIHSIRELNVKTFYQFEYLFNNRIAKPWIYCKLNYNDSFAIFEISSRTLADGAFKMGLSRQTANSRPKQPNAQHLLFWNEVNIRYNWKTTALLLQMQPFTCLGQSRCCFWYRSCSRGLTQKGWRNRQNRKS